MGILGIKIRYKGCGELQFMFYVSGKKNPTIKRVKLSMDLMQLSYFTSYFVEVIFRLILDGFESGF